MNQWVRIKDGRPSMIKQGQMIKSRLVNVRLTNTDYKNVTVVETNAYYTLENGQPEWSFSDDGNSDFHPLSYVSQWSYLA